MTTDVLWVKETYFKNNSFVKGNVDWNEVQPIVILVQDKYIRPILGEDLFDQISDQINTSAAPDYTSAVSALNLTLLNRYLKKCIIWYVLYELPPVLKYKIMNKGPLAMTSENTQATTLEEVQYMVNKFRQNAEMYEQKCIDYLEYNHASYPLYLNGNTTSDKTQAKKDAYRSSLFLEDDDYDCKGRTGFYN